MLGYWWLILAAAVIVFAAGAMLWTNAATAMARVVAPSAAWVEREARFNRWGTRLMAAGTALALISLLLAVVSFGWR